MGDFYCTHTQKDLIHYYMFLHFNLRLFRSFMSRVFLLSFSDLRSSLHPGECWPGDLLHPAADSGLHGQVDPLHGQIPHPLLGGLWPVSGRPQRHHRPPRGYGHGGAWLHLLERWEFSLGALFLSCFLFVFVLFVFVMDLVLLYIITIMTTEYWLTFL